MAGLKTKIIKFWVQVDLNPTTRTHNLLISLENSIPIDTMLDLSSPDGKGFFSITAIEHDGDIMVVHMEGKVEGYGIVRLSHAYEHLSDRSGGTLSGTAEAILDDGGIESTPHMGTFSRAGGKMIAYGTDFVTNGDLNFVRFEVDLINKTAEVNFWSLK